MESFILEARQRAALFNLRHLLFRLRTNCQRPLHISLLSMTPRSGFFINFLNNISAFVFHLYLDIVKREQQDPVIGVCSSY